MMMKFSERKALFVIFIVSMTLIFSSCNERPGKAIPAEKKREIANVLYNQQLFKQSVKEYIDYLNHYDLEVKEQANIAYMIGNIYFERLQDYENALAYYLRVKHLYPESTLQQDVSRKIVECLERMERSLDARQVIEESASLDESQKPQSRPGDVIAQIGDREITSGDLQYEMNRLPRYVQEQIQTREQKVEFLRSYIVQELLYDSAKRRGLDKDKEVREGLLQAEKSLMTQKLLQEEIEKEVNPEHYSNADVELYYKANKEDYAEKDDQGNVKRTPPFSEVQEQVAQDFMQKKQQEAYQRLVDRLMKAENVRIYESKFQ
ncbi:MAG: hypothetical protein EH225_05055 [Calditrichaeota bacterium]|nr:hypothetical protein [Calditrichota bacterium]RQV93158.1 MAG: hypothetical protein EH221_10170 [bacterium]RQW04990.1 MAG: hypothetical protein EH225_05055 [Calditrichota bacterium]